MRHFSKSKDNVLQKDCSQTKPSGHSLVRKKFSPSTVKYHTVSFEDKNFWRLPKALFSSRMPQISYLSYRCDLYILFIFTKTVVLISKTFSKTHYTGFNRCMNVYTLFAQPVSTHNKGALAVGTLVLKQQNYYPGWAKPSHLAAGSAREREGDQTTCCLCSEQQVLS